MIWHFAREKTHEILIDMDEVFECSQTKLPFFSFICEINKLKIINPHNSIE